jgi:hypothetical protein
MKSRLFFFILTGLIGYLSLSLYHDHQAEKLAAMDRGKTIASAANDREKSWIQVTTEPDGFASPDEAAHAVQGAQEPAEHSADDRILAKPPAAGEPAASPGHPVRIGLLGQLLPQVREDPAELRSALEREKMKADNLAREKELLLFRVDALQAELRKVRARLKAMEEKPQPSSAASGKQGMPSGIARDADTSAAGSGPEPWKQTSYLQSNLLTDPKGKAGAIDQRLRQAAVRIADAEKTIEKLNTSLAIEKKNRQDALEIAREAQEELTRSRQECGQYLVVIGRLETLLGKTKSRLVDAENEISRSRLQAEAMLYYGREQDRLILPFRQEIESLQARLQDMNSSLSLSQRQVADLRAAEQKLRLRINGQPPDQDNISSAD